MKSVQLFSLAKRRRKSNIVASSIEWYSQIEGENKEDEEKDETTELNTVHFMFNHYYYFQLLLLLFYSLRVFHTSVSWWFPNRVWVTAGLLKSPGLFSVFCPISTMLQFGFFVLILLLPRPSVHVARAPITIGITLTFMFHFFFQFSSKVQVLIFPFAFFSILLCGLLGQKSPQFFKFSFFLDYHKVWSSGWD